MKRITVVVIAVGALAFVGCSGTVLSLDVGTCFDDPGTFEEVTDVPIVDCEEPHDNEVFTNQDLPGDAFPGSEAVNTRAEDICYDHFASYVGIAYEESIYDIGWLNPTADSWDIGDREIICFAFDVTYAKITGSVEGVAQ